MGRGGVVATVAACLAASSAVAGDGPTTRLRGHEWRRAHRMLHGGTARDRQRLLQEATKQGDGNDVADEETAASSLFDSYNERDEILPDRDALPARESTDAPAAAPPAAPPSLHDGPHANDLEVIDPPSEFKLKEFLAFVGCYAFLVLCWGWYRHRRHARVRRENFRKVQSRLADIEQMRTEEEGAEGELDGVLGVLEREHRDRDWDLIERIFGPLREAEYYATLSNGVDVLDGIVAVVERERRRRAGRGRRLVAALKETSLVVRECHLIERGGADRHLSNADKSGEGLVERTKNCEDDEAGGPNNEAAESEGTGTDVNEENAEAASSTKDESNSAPAESSTADAGEEVVPATAGSSASSELPATDVSQKLSETDQTQQVDVAVPSAPQSIPIPSLYAVDAPYEDDDDNKYTALCLPISDQSNSATVADTTAADDATRQSQQRLVPATCAICLVQYSPGCHVAWSFYYGECTHAFHRDCILTWLWKNEEPLCPCCRQEFVPASALEEDADVGNGGGNGEITESENADSAGDAAGSASSRPPPQAEPRSVRYSNPPGSFSVGGLQLVLPR